MDRHQHIRSWLHHLETPDRLSPHQPAVTDQQSSWQPHHLLATDARPARRVTQSPSLFVRDSPLPSLSSASRDSEPRCEDYGRKPRRKTRPDRYDSGKRKTSSAAAGESRPKRRKTKKRRLRSEREVMDNFASRAIASNRLTLKPNLRPGSFLNGRSSAAAQPAVLAFYHLADVARPHQGGHQPRESKAARDLQDDADFFANIKANNRKQAIVIGSDRLDNSEAGRGTSTSRPPTASHAGTADYCVTSSQKAILGRASNSASPSSVSGRAATPGSRRRIPKWRFVEDIGHQSPAACVDVDGQRRRHRDQQGLVDARRASCRDHGVMTDARRPTYQDKGIMVSPGFGRGLSSEARRPRGHGLLHTGRTTRDGIKQRVEDHVTAQSPPAPGIQSSAVFVQAAAPAVSSPRPVTHDGVAQFRGYLTFSKLEPRSTSDSHHDFRSPGHLIAPRPRRPWLSMPAPDTGVDWKPQPQRHFARDNPEETPRPQRPVYEPQEIIARLDRKAQYQFEASLYYDRTPKDEGELVDRHEIDLQLHEVDTKSAARIGAREGPHGDMRPRAKIVSPWTRPPRRCQGTHDEGTADLAGFWRPDCLM
ncbi:hypothetical protein GQ602_000254 [Ophiocordyceps camponoti-floridani]|uniref:Uncharacterized protein n=1 Tax=Ophiocordyceps camponoti-floridani TaxID=2030778 RepID=A0A8H4QBT5_9HYPO|nr:hypothetical protein GQ602_000254 [Ophiocordyceps camponoti-floridani]